MTTATPAFKPGDFSIKRSLVHQMQRGLYLSGLAWAYRKMRAPQGGLILMYHSVVDDDIAPFIEPNYALTTDQFEAQLKCLKRHANVIGIGEMVACLESGRRLPENAVALTFDDGYQNNLTHAAPLLEKYDMPAMVYLCTGYIDRQQSQWADVLYSLFQFRTRQQLRWQGREYRLDGAETLNYLFGQIAGRMIVADIETRDRILKEITDQLRPSREFPRLTMSWDEVRLMRERYPNIEFGLHTVDHLDVTRLDPRALRAEIARSQESFERELGFQAEHFSYPYGRHDEQAARVLKEAGLKSAVITQPTALVTSETNRYMMPRYETTPSLLDLRLWLTGAFPALAERVLHRVYD